MARSDFRGVGSTRGEQPFLLDLACDAGARVNIQFDGIAADGDMHGVLALVNPDEQSSARGVGVQLLYRGAPLVLGERLPLETALQGLRSYPFSARYYQTQPQIAAGEANAVATLASPINKDEDDDEKNSTAPDAARYCHAGAAAIRGGREY